MPSRAAHAISAATLSLLSATAASPSHPPTRHHPEHIRSLGEGRTGPSSASNGRGAGPKGGKGKGRAPIDSSSAKADGGARAAAVDGAADPVPAPRKFARAPTDEPARAVPSFYFDEYNLQHRARLLRCGEQAAKNESEPLNVRMQLAEPVNHDVRGGLGAEVLLCAQAEKHPMRTSDPSRAEVVLLCPYLHYNNLLGRSAQCTVPMLGGKGHIARMLPFSKHAKASDAWARKLPHVFLTVNEFASYSYHTNGSPFGKPSPRWVVHANQDHFPTGVAHHHQHVMIPYMPSAALLAPAVRQRADAVADGAESIADPLLLFFRGTLSYGCQEGGACPRERLRRAFITLNATDVSFSGETQDVLGRSRTTLDYGLRPKSEQGRYVADMQRAFFCLAPSGHTCETRRFYDAIAAGCIPITVDCENNTCKLAPPAPRRRLIPAYSYITRGVVHSRAASSRTAA